MEHFLTHQGLVLGLPAVITFITFMISLPRLSTCVSSSSVQLSPHGHKEALSLLRKAPTSQSGKYLVMT